MATQGPLTAEQLDEFGRRGFITLGAGRIAEPELLLCRKVLLDLFRKNVGAKEGRNFDISARDTRPDEGATQQLFRPSLYAAKLRKWKFRETGLAIAKQILGDAAYLSSDNAVYKAAHGGGITPWHQDEAYNDPRFYHKQVTIWIALYETTDQNGAMAFIPGSNLGGILPHRLQGGSAEANSIECCGDFDRNAAVVCTLSPGAMTIHHGRTIHGAAANASHSPRLGYILNYKTPAEARPDLGTAPFAWNERVATAIHKRRSAWLRRGGILVELARFLVADRDNRRHFFGQFAKKLKKR